jgi:hypothetical protein
MYEDDTFEDEFEDDEFAEPIDRIIRRLKNDSLLEDDEEGFWLGFQRAA